MRPVVSTLLLWHLFLQVICIDNFFTGSKDNIAHLLDKTNFELIRHDVVEPILLEVDQIYHLACPASPIHYKWVWHMQL
jgi:UDP-glucuronate decarboxylase